MLRVVIDRENNPDICYSDEWKLYVDEDFDEKCVLLGNRHFKESTKAKWYNDIISVMEDLDYFDAEDFRKEYSDRYSEEVLDKVIHLYNSYSGSSHMEENEFISELAKVLFHIELDYGTIRGYNQGDWQHYICIKDSIDISALENYFFGKLSEVLLEDDDEILDICYIFDDDLWEAERGNLKDFLRQEFGLTEDFKVFERKTKSTRIDEEIE